MISSNKRCVKCRLQEPKVNMRNVNLFKEYIILNKYSKMIKTRNVSSNMHSIGKTYIEILAK